MMVSHPQQNCALSTISFAAHRHATCHLPPWYRRSSIHDSNQRCLSVHASNKARISLNTCFNTFGHGYFLEDGVETGNVFEYNIAILASMPFPTSAASYLRAPKTKMTGSESRHFFGAQLVQTRSPQAQHDDGRAAV